MSTVPPSKPAAKPASPPRLAFLRGRSWKFYAALAVAIPTLLFCLLVGYSYIQFSRIIDARMHGEFQRTDPRIFGRPLTIRRGQRVTLAQMVDRLNDLGYAQRSPVEQPGQFAIGQNALAIVPRAGDRAGQTVRFVFAPPTPKGGGGGLQAMEAVGKKQQRLDSIDARRAAADRARQRRAGEAAGRAAGGDPAADGAGGHRDRGSPLLRPLRASTGFGTARAVLTNIFGTRQYLSGGSTLTQQLVKNTFLTSMWGIDKAREKDPRRKFTEWLMSIALERRLSKDKVLELYLNDVVPRAARIVRDPRRRPKRRGCSSARTSATCRSSRPRRSPA